MFTRRPAMSRRRNPEEADASQLEDEEFVPALDIQPEDLSDEGIEHLTAAEAKALQDELTKLRNMSTHRLTLGQRGTRLSRMTELAAKLRGTHGLEESVRWLRSRARSLKGDLDAGQAAKAIRYIAGWSAEAVPAKKVVPLNANTDSEKFPNALDAVEVAQGVPPRPRGRWGNLDLDSFFLARDYDSGKAGDYLTPRDLAATFTVVPKGFDYANAPQGKYVEKVTPATLGPYSVPNDFPKDIPYARLSKVTVVLDEGDPVLRVTAPGHAPVVVPAGNKGWDTLYKLGLAEAAAGSVGPMERRVEARKAMSEAGWNKSLCAWCFGKAAVTPVSGHMVDHRYTRDGLGENINPCPGNRYPPYAVSSSGTQAHARMLEGALEDAKKRLAFLETRPRTETYHAKVEVLDARGRTSTKIEAVRYGDPRYPAEQERVIRYVRNYIADIRRTIPFLRAAVRLWTPGGADLLEVQRQVTDEDRARLNPRRNPLRSRSTRR